MFWRVGEGYDDVLQKLLELTEDAMRKVVGSVSLIAEEWRMRMLKIVPMLSSLATAEKKVRHPLSRLV